MFSGNFRTCVSGIAGIALAIGALNAPALAFPVSGHAGGWGDNSSGQLGNNATDDSPVPVAVHAAGVLAGKTVTAISAGEEHTCSVADGKAFCWGDNRIGQLGNNSLDDSPVPVAVDISGALAGKTVTAITAGYAHTCAVADGLPYCWGWTPTLNSRVPVPVDTTAMNGQAVTAISAGHTSTCAISAGQAFCWGDNGYGQLGNNSTVTSSVPVPVHTAGALAGRTVTALSAGSAHACAVADDEAFCWGSNLDWQLGVAALSKSTVPVAVDATGVLAGKTVSAMAAGAGHTCTVADGRAYCWGANFDGQLGNTGWGGSSPSAVDATGVLAGKTISAIAAGDVHTCAVADGQAYCWGDNTQGQLGDNGTDPSKLPVAVDTTGALAGQTVTAIDSGVYTTAVVFAAPPQPPTGVSGLAGDAKVTVSWTPPADDGGAPIQGYAAIASPGGATCTTGDNSCIVTGLTNGTDYTFTVTARNAIGTSPPSALSAPVTPTAATPPIQPPAKAKGVRGVKAKIHKGTVKVTWEAVTGATSYRVRISKPGGKKYKAWKTTTKRLFKATVRKGAKYRFQVAAVGIGGRGTVTTIRFKGK